MFTKKLLAVALVLGSAMVSVQASAQSYFGASLGRAKWNLDCKGAVGCHTGAASAKLFGGYDYNPLFGLEGSYNYFNEVGVNGNLLDQTFNGRGVDLAGVFKFEPMSNVVVFGKLGVAFMKGERVKTAGSFGNSDTNYSSQPLFGFGAKYQIDKKMAFRVELDSRRIRVAGSVNSTATVNNFSIGLQGEF